MADKTYQIDFELSDGTIKSVQFTVPGQIQSDWNQSDETAVDYIKNRPFSKVGDGLSISSDGKLSADTKSLGMTGTTVGQIVKIKAVDGNGKPTEWEAVTDSTPFIVEFSGDGSPDRPYTSSHTFEQITAAISAGRYVVGHAGELTVSGDSAGSRYDIYFNLVSTMDVAVFQFVDTFDRYQIDVNVNAGGASSVHVYGGYLSASTDTYGGVKADSAEETDTQPVRIGTDGKLYTAQVTSSGWTSDQISLLEVILNNIAYIDTTTGQTAADRLIASLRSSGTGTSDDISQSGSVLTIRALANTPTQSESILSIT